MKDYVPTYPNPDDDDRPEWEKKLRPLFSAAEDIDGEGARQSSLLPYYHHKPDRSYLLQLKYAVEKANEEAVRMHGPLPPGGLPVQKKVKPNVPYRDFQGNVVPRIRPIIEENDEMKLRQIAAAAALVFAGTQTGCQANHSAATTTSIAEISSDASSRSPTSSASDASGLQHAQTSGVKADGTPLQSELQSFVEPGMQIRAMAKGAINVDGSPDAVMVLESVAHKEKPRSVLLLVRDGAGVLHKAAQNDKMIPCADCGGMLGDPFAYVSVDGGSITIVNEGGAGLYWSDEYVFKRANRGWVLDKLTRKVVDRASSKSKTVALSQKDFGVISFEAVDPEKLPAVDLP